MWTLLLAWGIISWRTCIARDHHVSLVDLYISGTCLKLTHNYAWLGISKNVTCQVIHLDWKGAWKYLQSPCKYLTKMPGSYLNKQLYVVKIGFYRDSFNLLKIDAYISVMRCFQFGRVSEIISRSLGKVYLSKIV